MNPTKRSLAVGKKRIPSRTLAMQSTSNDNEDDNYLQLGKGARRVRASSCETERKRPTFLIFCGSTCTITNYYKTERDAQGSPQWRIRV